MKIIRLVTSASILAMSLVLPKPAHAISGSTVFHYYFSDPAMTEASMIGYTEVQCRASFINKYGMTPYNSNWNTYMQTHTVYEYYDESRCDTGGIIQAACYQIQQSVWVPQPRNNYYCPLTLLTLRESDDSGEPRLSSLFAAHGPPPMCVADADRRGWSGPSALRSRGWHG